VTKGGRRYPKGTLVRITYKDRGDSFSIAGITKDGKIVEDENEKWYCGMRSVEFRNLEIDRSIPRDPSYRPEKPKKRPRFDDDEDD
jgi:hypothetical protein